MDNSMLKQRQNSIKCYSWLTAYFRDATAQSTSVKGIRLNICDINWRPPQAIQAKKMLSDTLNATQSDKVKTIQIDGNLLICFILI